MFRKKSIPDSSSLEPKTEHRIPGLDNISSMLRGNSNEPKNELIIENTLVTQSVPSGNLDLPKPSNNKAVQLIQEVQKLEDRTIKPFIDYNEGRLFYPILSKIGEAQDNVTCLDDLVSDGILEKKVYEKLIVCPVHPDTFSSSMRLYCPKCHSMSVEKL